MQRGTIRAFEVVEALRVGVRSNGTAVYEMIPELCAPGPVGGRVTKSNPTQQFPGTSHIKYRGGSLLRGIWVTRITVTLSILILALDFSRIVENRETQLSSIFLSPGDIFSKSYDENRFVWQLYGTWDFEICARRPSRGPRTGAPTKSGFRHNFSKKCPQELKMG